MDRVTRATAISLFVLVSACGSAPQPVQQGYGPSLHSLTVVVSGTGSVQSSPAGIDCDEARSAAHASCQASFAQGSAVTLTATPASGFLFSGWEGACSGTGPCTVALNADASVTARFKAALPPPPGSFTITVVTHGSGAVRSDPAGIDCGQTCTASFLAGTQVTLSAAPGAGWKFSGWSGACGGPACTLSSAGAVEARFDQLPPPPAGSHALSVAVQGHGSVTSSPAGVSCDETHGPGCSASFNDGAQVTLSAAPAPGWQFSGFSGACSGQSCTLTMSSDQAVTATFGQAPPPPPADACDGLLPATLPAAVQAALPQSGCLDATSDDGDGNYLLGYWAGAGPTYPNYLFFTIQDGKAVRIGDTVPGSDESATFIFSQPSGFTSFHLNGPYGDSSISSWSHDGKGTHSQTLVRSTTHSFEQGPSSAVGIDPSGGTAVAVQQLNSNGTWTTWYQRLDKTGAPETDVVSLDDVHDPIVALGVALSGHALLLEDERVPAGTLRGRWLARDGSALTGWFELPPVKFPAVQFLMDGSVAVGSGSRYSGLIWKYVVRDSKTSQEALPAWMQDRPHDRYAAIRAGRGYAVWGPDGPCGGRSVEVLATTGKSCGCVNPPNAGLFDVGRDSSLIVSEAPAPSTACTFDLYPKLFR